MTEDIKDTILGKIKSQGETPAESFEQIEKLVSIFSGMAKAFAVEPIEVSSDEFERVLNLFGLAEVVSRRIVKIFNDRPEFYNSRRRIEILLEAMKIGEKRILAILNHLLAK